MKKGILLILIIMLAHTYIIAQEVAPLKPGNKWVYYSYVVSQGKIEKFEVTDSLKIIKGIPFYYVLRGGYSALLNNGFYAEYSEGMADSLYKYFKTNPQKGDTWVQPESIDTLYSSIIDTFSAQVFGQNTLIYVIDRYGTVLFHSREYWTEEFGMLNGIYEEAEYYLLGCEINGVVYGDTATVGVEDGKQLPTNLVLYQNYPNPFNPSTVISWQLAVGSNVQLKVYDLLGREIKTLVNQYYGPGKYNVTFHAEGLPSGIYFYRITTNNFSAMKKMMYLK